MSHCNEMICQQVTLSGYAEGPKVADAVIEALAKNILPLLRTQPGFQDEERVVIEWISLVNTLKFLQ